jgi:hypothetical protein
MKIKRGRLQQIIQEELKRVLREERNEPYMVVAKDFSGELVFHDASGRQNNLSPKIYDNKDDADQIAINQTSKAKTAGSPPLYVVPVSKVLRQIDDHPQRRVIMDLIDDFMNKPTVSDNDLDTDNDGMISVGELEKELQDIRDDLVDPEISGVIAAARAAGAKLTGVIDDENTVDLDDLDALAKAFKVSKTINHETEDASGTIEIGTINGEPAATWNVMGHTTWMR